METVMIWLGFIGAWALFAGPIYQASLELKDENIDIDESIMDTIDKPGPVSVWWWLLPPVKVYLEHRRSEEVRKRFVQALPASKTEELISLINKAVGWLYVAVGGLFIAAKETYELVEHMEWSLWVFWVFVFVLGLGSIMNVIVRANRSKKIIGQ